MAQKFIALLSLTAILSLWKRNMIFFTPFIKGFLIGLSLIVSIGAQNMFALRQGISRHYVFTTAFLCSLLDTMLITLGVFGVGQFIATSPLLLTLTKWGGFVFLIIYGCLAMRQIFNPSHLQDNSSPKVDSLLKVVFSLLAISLLNPHVYLDTVFLIGSVGGQYVHIGKIAFILGSSIASSIWFFSLCYGSKLLSPILRKNFTWRLLNSIIAVIMFSVALSLITM